MTGNTSTTLNRKSGQDVTPAQNNETGAAGPTKLSVDWELYAEYLDDTELNDDEKREFLEALWSIIVSFVDLGFELHPVQQACGEKAKNGKSDDSDAENLLKSKAYSLEDILKKMERNAERTKP